MDLNKELEELKKKITPMNTAKFVIGSIVSVSATAAVMACMKSGLVGAKGITKLLIKLGIFALACKAGDVAEDYFKKSFDEAEEAFKETQKDINEAVAAQS